MRPYQEPEKREGGQAFPFAYLEVSHSGFAARCILSAEGEIRRARPNLRSHRLWRLTPIESSRAVVLRPQYIDTFLTQRQSDGRRDMHVHIEPEAQRNKPLARNRRRTGVSPAASLSARADSRLAAMASSNSARLS